MGMFVGIKKIILLLSSKELQENIQMRIVLYRVFPNIIVVICPYGKVPVSEVMSDRLDINLHQLSALSILYLTACVYLIIWLVCFLDLLYNLQNK